MIKEIRMPSLGLAIEEVILTGWLKNEGDSVEKDEAIATGNTDKVTFEITSPISGYLIKKNCPEGDRVPVDKVVAIVSTDKRTRLEESSPVKEAGPANKFEAMNAGSSGMQIKNNLSGTFKASPLAKKIAEENAVDLKLIQGSGPQGLISKDDVLKYIENTKKIAEDKSTEETAINEEKEVEIIPFTGIRRLIADNMVKSKHTAAHVTTLVEIDMTEVLELKNKITKSGPAQSVSLLTFIIKAAESAIKEFPIINSSIEGDKIVIKKFVNMGVAVASKEGLIVPVIKDVQKKSFLDLANEIKDLTGKARENKLTPDMFKNGTITLSNAGTFGALIATPIINPPQSAILWMGKTTKRPVVIDNQIVIRDMMFMSLSYDHRVIDGSVAARFLVNIKSQLEAPLLSIPFVS